MPRVKYLGPAARLIDHHQEEWSIGDEKSVDDSFVREIRRAAPAERFQVLDESWVPQVEPAADQKPLTVFDLSKRTEPAAQDPVPSKSDPDPDPDPDPTNEEHAEQDNPQGGSTGAASS